ncbi:hypothetical protein DFR79_10477 [Halanaerobium saccharolyticum]|uniref:Uncharacterized protein n=1 Tax=Halanaerobium saccharolyticum TaxID=43595 RepID=A0A4V3CFJ8_9FIRM|nr:hypothetical protein [Halanaerobium saccharolyticum]TDO94112.1 hypothetical protein DFR79_10477 [Halanaerobium saccharolyticum]
MDSLKELKQNENLVINSNNLEEEIDAYFDNVSKEELIKDLSEAGIEMQVGPVQMPPMNINHFFDEEKEDN